MAETWSAQIVLGAIFGFIYGFILQKGDFCFTSAFRDYFTYRDTRMARGLLLALGVMLLGYAAVMGLGLQDPSALWVAPVGWNSLIGGALFGIGMVVAGSCASGTLYRAGAGYIHFWIVLAAMLLGQLVFSLLFDSVFNPLWMQPLRITGGQSVYRWTDSVPEPVIGLAVVALAVAVLAWRYGLGSLVRSVSEGLRGPKSPRAHHWDTRYVGLLLGFTATVQFALLSTLGITGPETRIAAWLAKPVLGEALLQQNAYLGGALFRGYPGIVLGPAEYLIIFIIIGSLASSLLSGDFRLRLPRLGRLPYAIGGGLLMGLASRMAPGCNVGNVLTGVAGLSIHSVIATVGIVLGVYAASRVMFADYFTGRGAAAGSD